MDAQRQLAVATGLVAAIVILGFRSLIDFSQSFLPDGEVEKFEGLDVITRILSVMGGACILALMLNRYSTLARRLGVVRVRERLGRHQGYLPLKNAMIQFIGGASAIMDRDFHHTNARISPDKAKGILVTKPRWLVINDDEGEMTAVLNPRHLAAFVDRWDETPQEDFEINLLHIPAQPTDVATISAQATVMRVQELLNRTRTAAWCVTRTTAPMIAPVVGVIKRNDIENYRD